MISIQKSALTTFTATQMYQIVADINAYPEFLNWCNGAEVLKHDNNVVVARVDIHFKGIKQSFTTSNKNNPSKSIAMELYDSTGPFKQLNGQWLFTDLHHGSGVSGSKVEFQLNFLTNNQVIKTIFQTVFSSIVSSQVDGFIKRANELYG